jgi:benzoyl-CoA 2,3-dioxygenase component A
VAALLADEDTYIYVCGLKGMEAGVLHALSEVAGPQWDALHAKLREQGRLHLETY